MCYNTKQSKKETVEDDFKRLGIDLKKQGLVSGMFNGFDFPATSVLASDDLETIQELDWGLVPAWAKDIEIRKHTLNAKIETLTKKPSFRDNVSNRCLVFATSFFEWQWQDAKGKKKVKYEMSLPENQLFAFAGIWSEWKGSSDQSKKSYSIITAPANLQMAEIHNSKKRMPVVLTADKAKEWLTGYNHEHFDDVTPELITTQEKNNLPQLSLF